MLLDSRTTYQQRSKGCLVLKSQAYKICLLISFSLNLACNKLANHSGLMAYLSLGDDRWNSETIPVCFEQANAYALDRQTIAPTIVREFAKAAYQIVGWETCRDSDRGIRIRFEELAKTSHTQAIGRNNSGLIAGISFGLNTSCARPFSGSNCEVNIALHEFGHALGLHHEMNRRDNFDCPLDQDAGEGEDDAIQFGAYDPNSIMNYCRLYRANDHDEALALSSGDMRALKNLQTDVRASLAKLPPRVLKEKWSSPVMGPGVSHYRWAVGPKDILRCDEQGIYSESVPVSQNISLDPEEFSQQPGTMMRLCLLGENLQDQRQDPNDYTSIDFQMISSREWTHLSQVELAIAKPPSFDLSKLAELGEIGLDFQLQDDIPLKSIFAKLDYIDSYAFRVMTNDIYKTKYLGGGHYHLSFSREQFPENGEIKLERLEVGDILGRNRVYETSAAALTIAGTGWMSPHFAVDWGYSRDGQAPVLKSIDEFPSQIKAGELCSFKLQIAGNSGLNMIQLSLSSAHSTLNLDMTWQKIADETYRVVMQIPFFAVNDEFILSGVYLEDQTGLGRYYNLRQGEPFLSPSLIVSPRTKLSGGIDFEESPPVLLGIAKSKLEFAAPLSASLNLDIEEPSGLKTVLVKFQHVSDQGFYKTIYGIDNGEVSGLRRIDLNIIDEHPQGIYALEEVILIDRFDNRIIYKADASLQFLSQTAIALPKIEISGDGLRWIP